MVDRPRRSTRQPVKTPVTYADKPNSAPNAGIEPSRATKRKAPGHVDPQTQLRNILESPRSILTTTDISGLLCANTWDMLSDESRKGLVTLLPPTAFADYLPGVGHPAQSQHDATTASDPSERALNPNFFNDPHFLDAAHTFQDHLFSGWLTATHQAKLNKYLDGIRDGTLAAPWKDEDWERESPHPTPSVNPVDTSVLGAMPVFGTTARAGASADLKLSDLVKDQVLRAGDIIAYKRNFSILGILVEKDTIIQSIDAPTHALTVLMPKGTNSVLPSALTCHKPDDPGSEVVSVTISTPQMLETSILDMDGRVKKSQRPNGNAWKCFTVWRWRDDCMSKDTDDQRGGRDIHGTLFYLRGCHYYER